MSLHKSFSIFTLLLLTVNAKSLNDEIVSDKHFENYLLEIINLFKNTMPRGIHSLKVPVLDPVGIPEIKVNVDEKNINLHGSITKMKIFHLSQFQVSSLRANLSQFMAEVNITLPRFEIKGEYDFNALFGRIIPLEGKGEYSVEGLNSNAYAKITMQKDGEYISCSDFDIDIRVYSKDFKFSMSRIFGDEQISKVVSEILKDVGVKIYNKRKQKGLDKLRRIVMDALNSKLKQGTFSEIIAGKIIPLPFDN